MSLMKDNKMCFTKAFKKVLISAAYGFREVWQRSLTRLDCVVCRQRPSLVGVCLFLFGYQMKIWILRNASFFKGVLGDRIPST